ncbi:Clp protease/crotonase-like domain-containing protein [Nonlabens xiamenensis]|uniref:hypothetical protein n=1 Tax=Nonlabens xiamenensis TaxID=2341043 RepID=UPI000F60FDBD|nr:hypothetical protein [Nonlabens xiamenensis]
MNKLIIILILITFSSCSSKQNILKGTFYNQENIYSAFTFNEKGEFSLLKKYGVNIDTISKGSYIYDKGYITLTSNKEDDYEFKAEINDYFDPSLESIEIKINSPFIEALNELDIGNTIYYSIFVYLQEGSFYKVSKKNIFTFNKPYNSDIESISITIKLDFFGLLDYKKNTEIVTANLYPKNPKSNIFQIYIPKLSVLELNKLKLKNEILKVKKGNEIQWSGVPYIQSENLWNE